MVGSLDVAVTAALGVIEFFKRLSLASRPSPQTTCDPGGSTTGVVVGAAIPAYSANDAATSPLATLKLWAVNASGKPRNSATDVGSAVASDVRRSACSA